MDSFFKKVEEIVIRDSRYKIDAYEFLMRALWFTQKKLKKPGHVSGKELLFGIRDFVLNEYGPMAKTVLKAWGIQATDDFGEIVFNMVESGLLHKTDTDSRDDFKQVYDFDRELDVFKNYTFNKLSVRIPGAKPVNIHKKPIIKNIN